MSALKEINKYKGVGRRFIVVAFMPPWMDCDGTCIAPPDPEYRPKYSVRGIHWSNEECVEWLKVVAGSKIVWLDENKFEYEEHPPAMTIAEWADWEVGKAQWELLGHCSELTLYFDEVFAVRMTSRLLAFDERILARINASVDAANLEIDMLYSKAMQRIEQFH